MNLQDGDWYEDADGIIWEYQYNIDTNQPEWVDHVDCTCGTPRGRKIDPPQTQDPPRSNSHAQERGTVS